MCSIPTRDQAYDYTSGLVDELEVLFVEKTTLEKILAYEYANGFPGLNAVEDAAFLDHFNKVIVERMDSINHQWNYDGYYMEEDRFLDSLLDKAKCKVEEYLVEVTSDYYDIEDEITDLSWEHGFSFSFEAFDERIVNPTERFVKEMDAAFDNLNRYEMWDFANPIVDSEKELV